MESNCLPTSCCETDLSHNDLERFTQSIENVLHDEKGRQYFRKYLVDPENVLNNNCLILHCWERTGKLLVEIKKAETVSFNCYLKDFEDLKAKACETNVIGLAIMRRLDKAQNKDELVTALELLKLEIKKELEEPYTRFKKFLLSTAFPNQ